MISSLEGIIDYFDKDSLIINVAGVGFRVFAPADILSGNQKIAKKIKLFTHLHVKEDSLTLYGFDKIEDLRVFKMLLTVSGVGPKIALAIFNIGGSEEITEAIAKGDFSFFQTASGVGKKNAQRIIVELKSKVGGLEEIDFKGEISGETMQVWEALKSLGISNHEARKALKNIETKGKTIEEKIKLALRYLGS